MAKPAFNVVESPETAIENIEFARGIMEVAGVGTDLQHECLADSVAVLRRLVEGVQKMRDNRDCGGDGWWAGWETVESTFGESR